MNYDQPHEIDDAKFVFKADLGDLLPPRDDIPGEFSFSTLINQSKNPYYLFLQKWFFEGVSMEEIPSSVEGVDPHKAIRHIQTILGSFEPKHEHKFEAVTYLMSLWFRTP